MYQMYLISILNIYSVRKHLMRNYAKYCTITGLLGWQIMCHSGSENTLKKKKTTPILEACMTSEKLMNLTESWECLFFLCFRLF